MIKVFFRFLNAQFLKMEWLWKLVELLIVKVLDYQWIVD